MLDKIIAFNKRSNKISWIVLILAIPLALVAPAIGLLPVVYFTFAVILYALVLPMIVYFRPKQIPFGEEFLPFIKKAAEEFSLKYKKVNRSLAEPWSKMIMLSNWFKSEVNILAQGKIGDKKIFLMHLLYKQSDGFIIFQDMFLGAELPFTLAGWVLVKTDETVYKFKHKGFKVILESRDFNKVYDVFTSDPKTSYQLLDPSMMMNLYEKNRHPLLEFRQNYALMRLRPKDYNNPKEEINAALETLKQAEKNFKREKREKDWVVKEIINLEKESHSIK